MTQAFNLSQLANNLNTAGQLDATDGLVGAVPVANGGTGRSTLTANNLIAGNGTGSVNQIAPGASGNYLVSNGTSWASGAPTSITNFIIGFGSSYTGNLYPSSRTNGVNYTNSSATRPLVVVWGFSNQPFNGTIDIYLNGTKITNANLYGSLGGFTLIVPPLATYRVEPSNASILSWQEY